MYARRIDVDLAPSDDGYLVGVRQRRIDDTGCLSCVALRVDGQVPDPVPADAPGSMAPSALVPAGAEHRVTVFGPGELADPRIARVVNAAVP